MISYGRARADFVASYAGPLQLENLSKILRVMFGPRRELAMVHGPRSGAVLLGMIWFFYRMFPVWPRE